MIGVNPTVVILTRTFYGHAEILKKNLISTANVFLNRNKYTLAAILDDERSQDHILGDELLENGRVDVVYYEPLPDNYKKLFQALAYPCMPWGYDRQQWSTFYMDAYVTQDIVGIVDSDSTFTSYLTDENIYTSDGKIKLFGLKPLSTWKHWCPESSYYVFKDGAQHINDDVALKFDTTYDLMCTNIMPMFFWRSSFLNFRNYIASIWGMSFDEAYIEFSKKPYCQFNILANFVLKFEPDKYEFVDVKVASTDKVIVAQNGCPTTRDVLCGLIKSFNLNEDHVKGLTSKASALTSIGNIPLKLTHSEYMNDTRHANNIAHFLKNSCSSNEMNTHYIHVHRDINALPIEGRAKLYERLSYFIKHDFNNIIIKG